MCWYSLHAAAFSDFTSKLELSSFIAVSGMASQMDIETGNVSMDTIKELVSKYTLYEVGSPTFHDDVPGNLSILDLPRYEMGETGVVKCFFDIVMDVAGPIPKGPLKEALLSKAVPTEFPEPYGLRKDPESVKIDIAVVPQNNGLFCVQDCEHETKRKGCVCQSHVFWNPLHGGLVRGGSHRQEMHSLHF